MKTKANERKEEAIAKLQNAASEGKERKRSVVTTLSLGDEAIAPRREGVRDESFAIAVLTTIVPKPLYCSL